MRSTEAAEGIDEEKKIENSMWDYCSLQVSCTEEEMFFEEFADNERNVFDI